MADLKITQLTADTTPQGADLLTTVKSPFGSGSNRKITVENFMKNQTVDWKTTGRLAIGSDATLGSYGAYETIWNFQETITDFTNPNQYSFLAEVIFDPSANISNLAYAGYEFLVTIPEANDKDITVFNFSSLEGFWTNNGSGDIGTGFGFFGAATHNGTGNITDALCAGYFFSSNGNSGSIIGDVQKLGNFGVAVGTANYGTGVIFRNYNFYAEKPYGTGEIKSNWGIYLEDQEIGTVSSYAIQTAGGKVEFGAPSGKDSLIYMEDGDVAHGMTSLFPTDIYGVVTSLNSTVGGLRLVGMSDSDAGSFQFESVIGSTTPSATTPAFKFDGAKKSGTGKQSLGNSDLLFTIVNNGGSSLFSMFGNGNSVFNGTLSVPGAGTSSERFGALTTAAGNQTTVLGNSAIGTGTDSVVIGYNSQANSGANQSVLIGSGIQSGSANGVTIGYQATNWSGGVSLGSGSNSGANGVAVGRNSGSGGTGAIIIGDSASGSGTNNIAIGRNASATGSGGATESIAIGASSATGFTQVIVIGGGATATAANQLLLGGANTSIANVFIGKGVTSATPVAVTIQPTGGNGSGINGADIIFAGGKGGVAADSGGSIIFKTAKSGSGTTLDTVMSLASSGTATFFGTNPASGSGNGIIISPTLEIMDGSDVYNALNIDITNANHTGSGNEVRGIYIDGITFDADALAIALKVGSGGWNYGINLATNLGISFGDSNNYQAVYGGLTLDFIGGEVTFDNKITAANGYTVPGAAFTVNETGAMLTQSLEIAAGGFLVTNATSTLGFFGVTSASQQTGGAATAGAVYTSAEQDMIQKAYDCLRTFGLLS